MLDLLIRNASVVDGSGAAAYTGDVGVRAGKLTLQTAGERAARTIEADGLTLCPGFIDSHSHGDMSVGTAHAMMCKVSQGVTTEVTGQCGQSAFPVDARFLDQTRETLAFAPDFLKMPYETFKDMAGFLAYADGLKLALNEAFLVGHNTLRASVMGVENRPASPAELDLMKSRLRDAMEHGAFGLSSGLIYIPGVYAPTEEVVELCRVIRPYGGVYATHMRNEAGNIMDSLNEAISIAEQADVPLVISHHKICGRANWGKSEETLRTIAAAAARGVRVMIDQYPYDANMTALNVCIPPQYFADGMPALMEKLREPKWRTRIAAEMDDPNGGYDNFYLNSGGFEGVFVSVSPAVPEAEGMTVAAYARKVNKTGFDAYFDLLLANEGGGNGIYFAMDEREVERIYCDSRTMVGSDALCFSMEEKGHPRAWGTFIRPLRLFAQEKGLLSFEQAVRKQTALTAACWGLANKGMIAEGWDADLVLLDRAKLFDRASYQDSNRKAEGVEYVLVAGEIVYRAGQFTGVWPGRALRRSEKGNG